MFDPSLLLTDTDAAAEEVLLVFDGVKMGATITLNGQILGQATDQCAARAAAQLLVYA